MVELYTVSALVSLGSHYYFNNVQQHQVQTLKQTFSTNKDKLRTFLDHIGFVPILRGLKCPSGGLASLYLFSLPRLLESKNWNIEKASVISSLCTA